MKTNMIIEGKFPELKHFSFDCYNYSGAWNIKVKCTNYDCGHEEWISVKKNTKNPNKPSYSQPCPGCTRQIEVTIDSASLIGLNEPVNDPNIRCNRPSCPHCMSKGLIYDGVYFCICVPVEGKGCEVVDYRVGDEFGEEIEKICSEKQEGSGITVRFTDEKPKKNLNYMNNFK